MASAAAICCGLGAFSRHAEGAAKAWNGTSSDFNGATSFTAGGTPGAITSADVAVFNTSAFAQPNVSASISVAGVYFNTSSASGYDLTASTNVTLTLTGYGAAAGATSQSSAAALSTAITSGSETIDAPILLAPASGTPATSRIQTLATGGSLIINGAISGTGVIANFNVFGGSTIQLSGANTYSGGSSLNASTLTSGAATIALGNDAAFGSGTVTFVSGNTLVAQGGPRILANNVVFGGSGIIGGSNAMTFNGSFASSGSSTRTLTVNNTATTTLAGPVYLASDTTARSLIVTGTGALNISGTIADSSAAGAAANSLATNSSYTGKLTLSGLNNSYTGTTNVSGGTVLVNSAGATGSGTVQVGGGATLGGTGSITGTVAIASLSTITAGSGATANDKVGTLTLNGPLNIQSAQAIYTPKLDGSLVTSDSTSGIPVAGSSDELVVSSLTSGASTALNITPVLLSPGSFASGSTYTFQIAHSDTVDEFKNLTGLPSGATIAQGTYSVRAVNEAGGGGEDLLLDFTDTAAAPEPTSILLLGTSAFPLLIGRRRRSRSPMHAG